MPDESIGPERPADREELSSPPPPRPPAEPGQGGAGPSGGRSGAGAGDYGPGPQYPPPPGGYPAPPGYPGPRRLTRRMDDRVFAGVASGLGAYFNVDPVVFRVGFVALTLAGGAGVLIYLLCWLILPPVFGPHAVPAAAGAPSEPRHQGEAVMSAALRQGGWKTYLAVGAVLLALVLLFSPFTRPSVVFALLLIALGVLLMVRDQPSGSAPPAPPGAPPPAPGDDQLGQWQPAATGTTVPPAGHEPTVERPPADTGTQPASSDPYGARSSAPAWGQPGGWGQPAGTHAAAAPRGGWGSSATAAMEPARRARSVIGWVTVALALLAGGVAGALDNFGVVDMTPARTLALMLTVVGVGLLVSSVWGKAGWLILVGILLLPAVAVTSVLNDLPVAGESGDRVERPLTVTDVLPEYQLAAGDLTIDLSNVAFGPRPTTINARVSVGQVRVIVPAGQPVTVHATVGTGDVRALGQRRSGFQVRSDVSNGGAEGRGRLTLNLRVGVGSVAVERGP